MHFTFTRRTLAALGLAAGLFVPAVGRGETLVVVRHADRDRSKPKQPLLPAGENRAREVGRLLHDERVDHIFYSRGEDEGPSEWLRRVPDRARDLRRPRRGWRGEGLGRRRGAGRARAGAAFRRRGAWLAPVAPGRGPEGATRTRSRVTTRTWSCSTTRKSPACSINS